MFDPKQYCLTSGTVQPFVVCHEPWFLHHFGPIQYDRDKPVLSESIRQQAQPIVDALNAGTMNSETAKKELNKI